MPAEKFDSWLDIKTSCKNSRKKLTKSINKINRKTDKAIQDVVDLEIERSMRRDCNESLKKLEKIVLIELNTLDEDDIRNAGLTERQVEIASLRQKMSIHKVAKELNISEQNVVQRFKEVIDKIEKFKRLDSKKKKTNILSNQQENIYNLMELGCSNREMAEKLNTSIGNIKKQKSIIRKKIAEGVTKIS